MDPDLEYILHVVGYVVSAHVMARATIGRGSGGHETTLTADLRDLFAMLDVYPLPSSRALKSSSAGSGKRWPGSRRAMGRSPR
jgi:hypothetical protein